jgi:hypothetical protein
MRSGRSLCSALESHEKAESRGNIQPAALCKLDEIVWFHERASYLLNECSARPANFKLSQRRQRKADVRHRSKRDIELGAGSAYARSLFCWTGEGQID